MGRRKISIKRIADDRNRHVTFIKRNNGLLKKAMELALLCDCEISLVVISDSGKATTFSTSNLGDTFDRVRSNAGVKELNAYSLSDYAKFSNEVADKDDDVVDIPILTSPDAPMYFPAGVTYSSQGDTRATDSLIAAMMLRNEETEHSSSGISIPPSYSSFSNRPVATKPKPVHPPGFTEATKRTHPPAANTTSSEVAVISSGSGEIAHSKEEGDGDNKHDRFDTNSPEVEVATILAASSAGTTPNEGHAMYETAPVRKDRKRPHEAIEENPFLSTRMDYLHPPPSYGQNYYGGHPMMYYPPAHHPPAHHPPPHHRPPHHPPQQGYMMYPPPTEAPAESRPTGTAPLERPSGGSNKQTHRYPPNMMMNHYPMNANMPMHPMGFDPNMQHMMANQYMMAQQANMYNRHPHGGHHGGGAFHSPYVPGDAVEEGESSDVTADV